MAACFQLLCALALLSGANAFLASSAARPRIATPSISRPQLVQPAASFQCKAAAVALSSVKMAEEEPKAGLKLDGESKFQLAILMSTNFLIQMGIGMIIPVLPLFAQSLGLGAAGVGLLVAVPQLTKLLFNLPVGHLVDVVGRKPPLIVGALFDGIGQVMTATSTTIGQLLPARLVVGVGSATGSVNGAATMAYTMDVVGKYPDQAGLLNGVLQAFGFLAFACGPALGGWLADNAGPARPFLLLGALQLICVPLKMLLPETLPPSRRKDAGLGGLRSVMDGLFETYNKLLADPKQRALLTMKCAFLCGLSLILTIVPLHAATAWGASATDLGKLYSFVTLLSLVVSPIAGVLADRIGSAPLAIGGSIATALSVACMPFATSQFTYYLTRSIWSAGEAFLITAYTTLALQVTKEEQRGARNSLDNQVGDVALLFLPLLFGAIGAKSFNASFWSASIIMLLANVAIVAGLKEPKAA